MTFAKSMIEYKLISISICLPVKQEVYYEVVKDKPCQQKLQNHPLAFGTGSIWVVFLWSKDMGRYAANTIVSVEKSRAEIERILRKYDAEEFAYLSRASMAMIGFTISERRIQFKLNLPPRSDFACTPERQTQRAESVIEKEWERACRQRWRALKLVIQAKLEAIECEISTVDDEFLAFMVLPSGKTIGEELVPQISALLSAGDIPLLCGS